MKVKNLKTPKGYETKDELRYQYWRKVGIAVSDAPLDYLQGEELDKYTDELMEKEKNENHPNR